MPSRPGEAAGEGGARAAAQGRTGAAGPRGSSGPGQGLRKRPETGAEEGEPRVQGKTRGRPVEEEAGARRGLWGRPGLRDQREGQGAGEAEGPGRQRLLRPGGPRSPSPARRAAARSTAAERAAGAPRSSPGAEAPSDSSSVRAEAAGRPPHPTAMLPRAAPLPPAAGRPGPLPWQREALRRPRYHGNGRTVFGCSPPLSIFFF